MKYEFLPNQDVTTDLHQCFKRQLKESYVDMLVQLNSHDHRLFSDPLIEFFHDIDASRFNGFHCFVYHYSIELAEKSNFQEAARLVKLVASEAYQCLPKFVASGAIDASLLSVIFDQVKKGTTHSHIALTRVNQETELIVSRQAAQGIEKLTEVHPQLASHVDTLVESILFFDSAGPTNERALSLTCDRFQSLILINGTIDPGWVFLIDKIIHEAAHTYLYAINLREELVLNTEGSVHASPLRKDARDMVGIYHATFVIQRLIVGLTHLLGHASLTDADRSEIIALLRTYHSSVDDGFATVKKHGLLSPIARELIESGQDLVKSLQRPRAVVDASP
ncbi:HEXXH motif-containing putative peptide modification protein [Trinickia sp. EG282A]|uniref:aKG-HExxH-type peptide beta-hydroxylase n=1 Tax=Trinickia sp. EG282A TaxID=3237013 RepID=UPI0034D23C46